MKQRRPPPPATVDGRGCGTGSPRRGASPGGPRSRRGRRWCGRREVFDRTPAPRGRASPWRRETADLARTHPRTTAELHRAPPTRGPSSAPVAPRHGCRSDREAARRRVRHSAVPGEACRHTDLRRDSRRDTVALPFTGLRFRAPKPLDPAYPRELKTIGDQLRKRRMDLGLFQREVAEQIGVSKDTYRFWECNATVPLPRQWPGIIRFLGYQPSPLGDRPIR